MKQDNLQQDLCHLMHFVTLPLVKSIIQVSQIDQALHLIQGTILKFSLSSFQERMKQNSHSMHLLNLQQQAIESNSMLVMQEYLLYLKEKVIIKGQEPSPYLVKVIVTAFHTQVKISSGTFHIATVESSAINLAEILDCINTHFATTNTSYWDHQVITCSMLLAHLLVTESYLSSK